MRPDFMARGSKLGVPKGGSFEKKDAKTTKLSVKGRGEMRVNLGHFISKQRVIAGLTQEALSQLCDYDYNIATCWENGGKPHVQPEDISKIVEALKLPENAFEEFMPIIIKRTYKKEKDKLIAKNLDRRLKEEGKLPVELARDLELYPQHIDGYLKGKTEPKIFYIKQIVKILYPKNMQMEGLSNLLYGTPLPKRPLDEEIERLRKRVLSMEQSLAEIK